MPVLPATDPAPPLPAPAVGARTRADLCPGLYRPWRADDGLLVRLRPAAGPVAPAALRALLAIAERYGDGRLHVTGRANLQLRALPDDGAGRVRPDVRAAVEATGLVPSRSHELVRNLLVSPRVDGLAVPSARADLRPLAAALDAGLRADADLAALPGRFLLVLDDGRGDLLERVCDLGAVALDAGRAQLRVGAAWGVVVSIADAAAHLLDLARAFLTARGSDPGAAWHVAELDRPLVPAVPPDPALPPPAPPLPFGTLGGGAVHHPSPADGWDRPALEAALAGVSGSARHAEVVVTPWRGLLVAPTGVGEPGAAR